MRLTSEQAQLKAFIAEVKRALEKNVSKDAKQETKRLEAQAVTFAQCRTLLHFIQMMCEGHNGRIQDYLRVQDDWVAGRKTTTRKINIVSEVVHFFREVTESMPERLSFVPAYHADVVEASLTAGHAREGDPHVALLLGHAASQRLDQIKLILWSDYSETDVQALAMQFQLLEQALDTLAEFVQGPCEENQLVLARSCVCENVMPLLEFLLALQLSGGKGKQQPWKGHSPLQMSQLLEHHMERKEDATGRDVISKFARKLEGSEELQDLWQQRGNELLAAARSMERKLLVMISGMLEGEAHAEVTRAPALASRS